mmetsp:Transcript_23079/g.46713  ORF Transcript_23079/g.46713 Transcript_23079/m.46713 type:complete len:1317 (+) Transcript_23079:171-4121(+)
MAMETKLSIVAIIILGFFLKNITSHGYLSSPRSRNLAAYEETVWWPQTENDPQPETCPHCLNLGGSLARCGISQEQRNYDAPRNALGGRMPTNIQATYFQGQDVVLNVTLTAHHKGHFVFSACPIEYGEVPSQSCFDKNKLVFVEDLLHGAVSDPNYPERAYIPPVNDPNYVPNYGTTEGFMELSYRMRLPPNLYGDLVLIQWYYLTANSCVHEGYQSYNWPTSWDQRIANSADICGEVSSDGTGVPEQFWNCAEVTIMQNLNPTVSNPTNEPTSIPNSQPTRLPSQETLTSEAMIPVGVVPSEFENNNPPSSVNYPSNNAKSHDKTVVGYYASWQWYDRNKLAEPANMDFSKVQRVNFAFFQVDTQGNIWGTDSWADPNLLFGPYDWNPSSEAKQYCSWDTPTGKVCNFHFYEKGLIYLVHQAGAEIYPSLGGWTLSDPFPAMAANDAARVTFATNCVKLIIEYGFDGVDIDWEYPGFEDHSGTPQDRENFSLLLTDVRDALDQLTLETGVEYGLTAALPCGPGHILNMDVQHVASTLSELNLMTYDFHGSWSETTGANAPLYNQGWGPEHFSVHECVNNWLAGGGPRDKINIGLPFYGRSFLTATGMNQPHDGADKTVWGIDDGTPQYFNIVAQLPSMTSVWDKATWTEYAYFDDGGLVSYDNENAICAKVAYAIDNNLAGFIIWELSGDLMSDLSTPLLDVVNKKLLEPNYNCGEPGIYPGVNDLVPAPLPANPPSKPYYPTPGSDSTPIVHKPAPPVISPMELTPNPLPVLLHPPSPSSTPNISTPEIATLPTTHDRPPTPILLVCGSRGGSLNIADSEFLDVTFSYELHRPTGTPLSASMNDVKSSILNSIASALSCGGSIPPSVNVRRLLMLRNNPTIAQENIIAVESTSSDTAENASCTISVYVDEATVCHAIVGSLTAYFKKGTEPRVRVVAKDELLFIIRTGMASGRYESSSVKKVIYVNEVKVSPVVASGNEVIWSQAQQQSSSTMIAIILSALLVVLAGLLTLLFVRRRKTASETFRSHSYFNETQPHVDISTPAIPHAEPLAEDVWQKAYNTWRAESYRQEDTATPNYNEVEIVDSCGHYDDQVLKGNSVAFTTRAMSYGAMGDGWIEDFDNNKERIEIDHSYRRGEKSEPKGEFSEEVDEASEEGSKSGCEKRNVDELEPTFDEMVADKGFEDNKSSLDDNSDDVKCTHDKNNINDQAEDATSQASETNSQNGDLDSGSDSNSSNPNDMLPCSLEQSQETFDETAESKSPDSKDQAYDQADYGVDDEATKRKITSSEISADDEGLGQNTCDVLSTLQHLEELD